MDVLKTIFQMKMFSACLTNLETVEPWPQVSQARQTFRLFLRTSHRLNRDINFMVEWSLAH
jgi:hypothetical protein